VEFAILGPLEVRLDGRVLALGGPKQRAVLAILLLHANEVVSRNRLIEGLWDEWPPSAAQRSIDSYVSRLRTQLGKERVVGRPPGYAVSVEPGELDLDRFETLLETARASSSAGNAAVAAETLRGALALWRGPALADLAAEPFARMEVERLDDRRLLAVEELNDARLALGQDAELVAELRRLAVEHPFRERLVAQLMLALYRAGRQAEALAAFQRARLRLAEDLGLEPSSQLRELERRILEQDTGLNAPTDAPRRESRKGREPRKTSRWRLYTAGTAAVVVASVAVVAGLLVIGRTEARSSVVKSSEVVGLSMSSGGRETGVPLAGAPAAIGADGTSLWVADADDGTVSRVDLSAGAVVDRIAVSGSPGTLAVGDGFVWVAGVPGANVLRIDPATETVTKRSVWEVLAPLSSPTERMDCGSPTRPTAH
jgi:DNA-binding SARP family transcriptional activator